MRPAYAPLPFALAHLGWAPGLCMLILAGVVTWYTSLLLASLDRHDGVRLANCRKKEQLEKCMKHVALQFAQPADMPMATLTLS